MEFQIDSLSAQKTLYPVLIGEERHLVIVNLKAPLRQLSINTCKITAVKPHFPTTINGEIGLEPGNSKGVEKPQPKEKTIASNISKQERDSRTT